MISLEHSQTELNVSLSPGAPPSPILSLNATLKTTTENNHTAVVQWDVSFENTNIKPVLNGLLLQFSPSVPECGHNCSLARDTGPLTAGQMSVTLEVGTRYEVVARAESCGGDLSSPWSDPLTIHLQGGHVVTSSRKMLSPSSVFMSEFL